MPPALIRDTDIKRVLYSPLQKSEMSLFPVCAEMWYDKVSITHITSRQDTLNTHVHTCSRNILSDRIFTMCFHCCTSTIKYICKNSSLMWSSVVLLCSAHRGCLICCLHELVEFWCSKASWTLLVLLVLEDIKVRHTYWLNWEVPWEIKCNSHPPNTHRECIYSASHMVTPCCTAVTHC